MVELGWWEPRCRWIDVAKYEVLLFREKAYKMITRLTSKGHQNRGLAWLGGPLRWYVACSFQKRYMLWSFELVGLCGPQQIIRYTKYTIYIYIFFFCFSNPKNINTVWKFQTYLKFRNFEMLKTCVWLFFVQIRDWDGSYRIEETKINVCHFKEIDFWLKNLIVWHRGS